MARELIPLDGEESSSITPFLLQFALDGEPKDLVRLKQGHLHDTFIAIWKAGRFLHQRINQVAFPRTEEMLRNTATVVDFLASQSSAGFPATLALIPTKDGAPFLSQNGEYWRTYSFVESSESHDTCPSPAHGKALGKASARFIALLSALDPSQLVEHQPNFQDTSSRIDALVQGREGAADDRVELSDALCDQILSVADDAAVVSRALNGGELPTRSIHFDTKVNNFLFREGTDEVLCLVDLDLCMPGTALYDFGDLVRSASSVGREDEQDLSRVGVDGQIVRSVTEGFLSVDSLKLSAEELRLLPDAPFAISLNLTSRFLADFLTGDRYFPISRPQHNLERAKAQWRVTQELREKREVIAEIVQDREG